MEEEIKGETLVDFPGYLILKDGQVYGKKSRKFLKPQYNIKGYLRVMLYREGSGKWLLIHRLVALAFHKNPDGKPIVDHIDEDIHNNHKDNLQWVTRSENIRLFYTRKRSKSTSGVPF